MSEIIEISNNNNILYRYDSKNQLIKIEKKYDIKYNIISNVKQVFIETFLPYGYPKSVRNEYLSYQFWDSIQGLSSYLRGVLTARSVLQGAGVGSAEASALSAALVWTLKDGIGMISSLLLAYKYSNKFEINCKEWRLLADVLNNIGLTLDMLTMSYPSYFLVVTSISMICKSCCGLIAGSTKARISNHFALNGQLADVTAKESTQETAVALIGLSFGLLLAQLLGNDEYTTWIVYFILLIVHQWANYNLVKVLVLDTLNPQRSYLLATNYTQILSPNEISKKESIFFPIYLSIYGPKLGASIYPIISAINTLNININSKMLFTDLLRIWQDEQFIIGYDVYGTVITCLYDNCSESDRIKAYFIGSYLHKFISPSSVFRLSTADLKHRYDYLINKGSIQLCDWYNFYIDGQLESAGWDISENSSRLGENIWRLKSKDS